MFNSDTFYKHDGGGLAANQVCYEKRFLLILNDEQIVKEMGFAEKHGGVKYCLNPVLVNVEDDCEWVEDFEGCLSIPDRKVKVSRPEKVEVSYQNMSGELVTEEMVDWEARTFLHEYDHLDGILMSHEDR